jgi:hypothetical protein
MTLIRAQSRRHSREQALMRQCGKARYERKHGLWGAIVCSPSKQANLSNGSREHVSETVSSTVAKIVTSI